MNTAMLLAGRFDSPVVPLDAIAQEFFGLTPGTAARRANERTLPVPAARLIDSQRAPWLVHVDDLGSYMDKQFQAARKGWADSSTQPRESNA